LSIVGCQEPAVSLRSYEQQAVRCRSIQHIWEQRRAEANERTTEQERRVKAIQKLDRLDEAFLYFESIDLTSYSRFFPEGIACDGNRFDRTGATAPLFSYLAPSESADEKMVSREGIEPSTRRLRVCCSAN
jgi:hypothetical protein